MQKCRAAERSTESGMVLHFKLSFRKLRKNYNSSENSTFEILRKSYNKKLMFLISLECAAFLKVSLEIL